MDRRIHPLQSAISALFVVIALLVALAVSAPLVAQVAAGSAAPSPAIDVAGAKPPDIDICPVCVPDEPPPQPEGWA